ncbi:hypothetical protein PHLGIDRAFT_131050 [Phlebiopsis gigantea 11061_1 CR5-6]|uniref:ATP-grasp domain-containing protein n=1 Tax=Phlebiopsis gigantea (strain 11061_1 CR5-6) TaxID=745531 RepID=A0A0C3NBP3_PHLG1|nr:hypothetical protein PHLGIDRAFT_131050 [Phlebiopsis gigantea 11061_1 CR5-6]
MAIARKVRPTLVQSNRATLLLLTLSLLVSPVTLSMTAVAWLFGELTGTALGHGYRRRPRHHRHRTVLITGGRANKALTLCRAFKHAGYRVILAEEEKWGLLTCARFSRAVDFFHLLPDPLTQNDAYIETIKRLIPLWSVDIWVPCSSVHATMVDSEAAVKIETELNNIEGISRCESFIPFPEVAGTLHWKDQFEQLCIDLRYPIPESKKVTSVHEAVEFLHSREALEKGHKYLLKSLTLDDLGRDDFTLYPLPTRDETRRHLSTIPTPISERNPFILQRFLFGPEYCTHVAARDGEVVAFVACRSNQLLMRYADVRNLSPLERQIGQKLEQWTQEFLHNYREKLGREGKEGRKYALTGHFSFDFIVEGDTIYVIECNVRAHTAVALFSDHNYLAEHYTGKPNPHRDPVARPSLGTAPRSWITHAFPLALARLLPHNVCNVIHPQLVSTLHGPADESDPTLSPRPREHFLSVVWRYATCQEKDGIWDWRDPVPFFVLHEVRNFRVSSPGADEVICSDMQRIVEGVERVGRKMHTAIPKK